MENHPSRASLGRWPRAHSQARVVLALGLLALSACAHGDPVRPQPIVPRLPAREILVRTTSFTFRMGAAVDETWPEKAEETRASLGAAVATLLEEEDTTVPILARELGVTWPNDPLAFDVILRDEASTPCGAKLPRLLQVGGGGARVFFACALERAFARLGEEGALRQGMTKGRGQTEDSVRAEPAELDRLYACVVAYAVAAVMVARADGKKEAREAESRLGDACTPGALQWVAKEWIRRVKEEESAEEWGERAGREMR
jgi:hypothetical protein